jgi:ABC-type Na+ transport system ATPase subunit NatA
MRFVLRASDARYERGGVSHCPAISLEVRPGELHALAFASEGAASAAALLLSGLIKATHGFVIVGDFDAAMQPAQAKRHAALVSVEHAGCSRRAFDRELRLRAGLWSIEPSIARRRAGTILDAFGGDDAFGRALALACCRNAPLLVLDRPPSDEAVRLVRAIAPGPAVVAVRSALALALDPGTRAG